MRVHVQQSWRAYAAIAAAVLFGCAAPMPDAPAGRAQAGAVTLRLEPDSELGRAPSVFRVHVRFAAEPSAPPRLALYAGVLSKYYLARLRDRELPQTLVQRLVPAMTWAESAREYVLAPEARVGPGAVFSVVEPELGLIAELTVTREPEVYFQRLWPPASANTANLRAVYCGPSGYVPESETLTLSPGSIAAELEPGADPHGIFAEQCFRLEGVSGAAAVPLYAPPSLGQALIDPTPLVHGEADSAPEAVTCTSTEQRFGPACALVQDERMLIRSSPEPSLWVLRSPDFQSLTLAPSTGKFVLRGFRPDVTNEFDWSVTDTTGISFAAHASVRTQAIRTHIAINEVLANPLGIEPNQEWVELVNDGLAPVDLGGSRLGDGPDASVLPAYTLAPNAFVLVVARAFSISGAMADVPPPPDCVLLRVSALGGNGLSNSGEALTLTSSAGEILSRFPALAAAEAGVSLARKLPWALDDDPASFAEHGGHTASPCAPNTF